MTGHRNAAEHRLVAGQRYGRHLRARAARPRALLLHAVQGGCRGLLQRVRPHAVYGKEKNHLSLRSRVKGGSRFSDHGAGCLCRSPEP